MEFSFNGNSNDSSEDDEVSVSTRPKVDRQYTLERKAKSMPSDIQRDIDILSGKSKENIAENVQFLSDRDEDTDDDENDSPIWEPPEDENVEEDEEYRREMLDKAKSKFKSIVSQLFESSGLEESKDWLEIVARLSWEAASLLKPTINGKPVDPTEYIKVKCIATGSCNQSEVFKGLVFKKHAAHKNMPTKYEHPRVMLVEGVLGQPVSGFSSFQSMDNVDYVAPVVSLIEALKPNVMLVEKSVSRDIQLSILEKKVTLVLDMKLHRLQRISRCIGSPIISLESLSSSQELEHCDSFWIEKIVEEHSQAEKKPTKTLMFLEGFPTHLGCTILLKGSNSDMLKKVKEVVHYSYILAFHLILEASFLADRQTMFSTIFTKEAEATTSGLETEHLPLSTFEAVDDTPLSNEQTIEISGETETDSEKGVTWDLDGDNVFSHEPYNPVIFTGFLSLSAKLSKYLGYTHDPESVPVYLDIDESAEGEATPENDENDPGTPVNSNSDDGGDRTPTELDSQSILVLVSKRNAVKGIMCNQSHFSHIKFYKHFDVPLESFLRDMFNQRSLCQTCVELPESHLYYYAHHNKQLTVQVKRIPITTKSLPGEEKGKIWMWSRCGKCKTKNMREKSTKRVVISTAARSLSFGKFLELNFTQQTYSRLSSCGHSFDRDFLHFFGLGSMVAILSYSQVISYRVSLPPMKLEASFTIKAGWLEKEFERVFTKGISLFEDAASFLKKLKSQFKSSDLNALKLLSYIEELLKSERSGFEENMKTSFDKANTVDDVSYKLLRLNRLRWELLLQALIWNHRLQSLVSSGRLLSSSGESNSEKVSDNGNNVGTNVPHVEDKEIPIIGVSLGDTDQMDESYVPNNEQGSDNSVLVTRVSLDGGIAGASNGTHILGWDEWFWLPFEELRLKPIVDVEKEYLTKFEHVNQESLQTLKEIITEEGSRVRISLRDDDFIVSDYEDEHSSLIACALARLNSAENKPLSRSIHGSLQGFMEKDQDSSKQTIDRLSSETTNWFERLSPPEDVISFGLIKSVGKPKFSVMCLYADEFRDLRRRCCSSETDYIASLSRCKPWNAQGGKSKSVFAKTLDDRFIAKEIQKTEYESFVKFAPEYFKYMKDSYDLGNQTCLSKVLGIYQVTVRHAKSGKETRHDLMVMENLSFGRKFTRQYDLKGALHARFIATSNGAEDVLLDQNFVNDMNKSPFYVSKTSKQTLQRALYNDTSFLTSINVMDYSLLVGVDDQSHELVCGIIDYLRQYTWDKQLETWVKASLVVPKNVQPTVISPVDYKTRLRKFMKTYFLVVPDQWCIQEGDSINEDKTEQRNY